jgi:hypothetical protein
MSQSLLLEGVVDRPLKTRVPIIPYARQIARQDWTQSEREYDNKAASQENTGNTENANRNVTLSKDFLCAFVS